MEFRMLDQARLDFQRRRAHQEAVRKKNQAPDLASELYKFLRALQIWRLQGEQRDSAVAGMSNPAPYDDVGVLDTREIVDEMHPMTEDIHILSVERIRDSSVFYMAGGVQGEDKVREEKVEKEGIWVNMWKEEEEEEKKEDWRSEMKKDWEAWKMGRKENKEMKRKEKEEKKAQYLYTKAQAARAGETDTKRKSSEPKPLVICQPRWRIQLQMGMLQFKEDIGVFGCDLEERLMGKSNYSWDGGPGGRYIICKHCKEGTHHRWRQVVENLPDEGVEYEATEVDEFGDPIWVRVEMANGEQDPADGFAVAYQAHIT